MDPLRTIDPTDLQTLLESEPTEVLGRIIQLNRSERYHNGLNALLLTGMVIEMKAAGEARKEREAELEGANIPLHPMVCPLRPDQ